MKLPRLNHALLLAFGASFTAPALAIWRDYDEAEVVLGRTSLPSPLTVHMCYDIAISPVSGKVFVVDHGHNRVLRYPATAQTLSGQAAEAVFGQPDLYSGDSALSQSGLWGPQAVVVDGAGNLWVTDTENNRIMRWSNADTAPSGSAAAQVLGQTSFTTRFGGATPTGLSRPGGLAVDAQGRLWVADYFNNRVLRYDNPSSKGNAGPADGVIGQANLNSNVSGTTATTFNSPYDLDIDAQGRLWVADFSNGRILRFDNPTAPGPFPADGVLGQPDFTSSGTGASATANQRIITVEVTPGGSVFAVDTQNSRILRWDNAATAVNGAPANGVLGRTGLNQNSGYSTTPGAVSPGTRGMTSDAAGNLWAADRDTERVLRWNNAANKADGAAADSTIGDPSPNSSSKDVNPALMARSPKGGLEDAVSGKFFVADEGRVLRYASRHAAETGAAPEAVLGKPTVADYGFSSSGSQTILSSAGGLAMDSAGKLWVCDYYCNRVVAFANAATAPTGSPMSVVLGQANYFDENAATHVDRMGQPKSLAIDPTGHLYVADTANNRVLRFDSIATKTSGAPADGVLGQQDFDSSSGAGSTTLINPSAVVCDAQGRLWISETGRNQVRRYNTPATAAPLQIPDGILGGSANLTASGMNQPAGLALDAAGRLFVMDYGFNRVLRFDQAAAKPNGANADGVLGEPNFTSYVLTGRTRRVFERPYGLFSDLAGNVWVADEANLRLMRFSPESSAYITQSGAAGANYSLTFHGEAGITYTVKSSTDLEHWETETSYPFAEPGTQTFTKAKAGPRRFYRVEEP